MRQLGLPDRGRRRRNVVGDSLKRHNSLPLPDLDQRVAPAGIAVFWIAGRPDIEKSHATYLFDVWTVCMPADDDVRVGSLRDAPECRLGTILVEILIDPSRAAVDEQEFDTVEFKTDLRSKRTEEGFVLGRHMCLGPLKRPIVQATVLLVSVGAPALVTIEAGSIVVIPHHGRDLRLMKQLDDVVWERPVANDIAEAIDLVDGFAFDLVQDRPEGVDVPVNITEDREPGFAGSTQTRFALPKRAFLLTLDHRN
jgi:hypothetical protein